MIDILNRVISVLNAGDWIKIAKIISAGDVWRKWKGGGKKFNSGVDF